MYLLRVKVDDDVLDKVSQYYDYHWSRQGGVIEQEVVDELPISLRNAVSSHISGALSRSLPFFSRCDEATINTIASVLIPRVFMPNDCIVQGKRNLIIGISYSTPFTTNCTCETRFVDITWNV